MNLSKNQTAYFQALAFLLLSAFYLSGQQSINSAGSSISGNGNISFSVGQVNYNYVYTDQYYIIEGVQQPAILASSLVTDLPIQNLEIKISPNPSEQIATISTLDSSTKINTVLIYNSEGHLIFKKMVNTIHFEFNLQNYPAGIYFICTETENFQSIHKLIKTK